MKRSFPHSATIILILIVAFPPAFSFAQDEEGGQEKKNGFFPGISMGAYFGNSGTASFYEGKDPDHGIDRVLSIDRYYRRIRDELKHDFRMGEYPENMSYETAFVAGLNGGIRFAEEQELFVEMLYTRLRLSDAFTLIVEDPGAPNQERIATQEIHGSEERFLLRVAYGKAWGDGPFRLFGRIGFSGGWAEAKENRIRVEGMDFSVLPSAHPNYGDPQAQKGLIYGGDIELGVRMKSSGEWGLEGGGAIFYTRAGIGEEPSFASQQGLFLRLIRSLD